VEVEAVLVFKEKVVTVLQVVCLALEAAVVLVVVMVEVHNFLILLPHQPEDYMAVAVLEDH
jgi:hypothetical protein